MNNREAADMDTSEGQDAKSALQASTVREKGKSIVHEKEVVLMGGG